MTIEVQVGVQSPETAKVMGQALTTLSQVVAYTQTVVSEDLNLAIHIAELRKTEAVIQAYLAEISRKRQDLENRQVGRRPHSRY